jgi:hypothetical protein
MSSRTILLGSTGCKTASGDWKRRHAHRAKLMLALRAYGAMLLVDSGRFQVCGVRV